MKSLKRTLCLVLALVMVLGLFGIASATNFTDDDSIQYKEAVEVITGLGAINGMGDGTFNPKGTITRAQAAKLVTYVALSNGVADTLTGVSSNFTDVTAEGGFAWAIPSIEYLVSKGIINGMGDGTFNPNGEISGYAVLKMLLCVLGYGKEGEYVGESWELNVAIDSSRKDIALTTGRVKGAPALSAPATREELALYCYNALGVSTVVFDKDTDSYVKTDATIGESVYGLDADPDKAIYGIVTKNGAINAACAKDGLTAVTDGTSEKYYKIDTGLDMVGHYVRVYADTSDATITGATVDKAIDTYTIADKSTVVTVSAAESAKITTADAWAKTFGKDTIVATSPAAVKLGADYKTASTAITKDSVAPAGTYILGVAADKTTQIFAHIVPNTAGFEVAKVTSVTPAKGKTPGSVVLDGSSAQTVVLPGSEDTVQVPNVGGTTLYSLYDGIAKDDIVTIATTGDFKTVVKATTEEGTIASAATDATTSVVTFVANGKTYTVAPAGPSSKISSLTLDKESTTALGSKCTIYMGPDGKVIGLKKVDDTVSTDAGLVYVVGGWVEEVEGATSYGETADSTYLVMAQCIDMNGEIVSYTVGIAEDENGADTAAGSDGTDGIALDTADGSLENFEGKLVTVSTAYNEALKGDLATLKLVEDDAAYGKTINVGNREAGSGTALKSTDVKLGDHDYLDASTKFIFVGGETGKLSTTKTAVLTKDQALGGATTDDSVCDYYSTKASATDANYTVKYVIVTGEEDLPTSTDGTGLIFVPKFDANNLTTYEATTAAGKVSTPAVQTTVFIDGAPANIITAADGKDADNGAITTAFYTYTVNADGLYTLKKASSGVGIGVVTNVYNGTVTTAAIPAGTKDLDDVSLATAKFNLDLPALTGSAAHGDIGIGDNIAYTYSTTDSVKTVTGVYYLGTPEAVTLTKGAKTDGASAATTKITASVASGDDFTIIKWNIPTGSTVTGVAKTIEGDKAGTYSCLVMFDNSKLFAISDTLTLAAADVTKG